MMNIYIKEEKVLKVTTYKYKTVKNFLF